MLFFFRLRLRKFLFKALLQTFEQGFHRSKTFPFDIPRRHKVFRVEEIRIDKTGEKHARIEHRRERRTRGLRQQERRRRQELRQIRLVISTVIGQILSLEPAQKRAVFRSICRRTLVRYAAMMACDAERHHLRHASAEPSALLIIRALPQLHDLLRPCRRMIDAAPAPFLLLLVRTQIRLKPARILADIVVQAQEPPHRLLAKSGGKAPRKIGNARQMVAQKLLASCFLIKMSKIRRRFCHFKYLQEITKKLVEDRNFRFPSKSHTCYFDKQFPFPVYF